MLDAHLMDEIEDEMENNTFAPRLHIVYLNACLFLQLLVHLLIARANKTSPGTVSFFIAVSIGPAAGRNFFMITIGPALPVVDVSCARELFIV